MRLKIHTGKNACATAERGCLPGFSAPPRRCPSPRFQTRAAESADVPAPVKPSLEYHPALQNLVRQWQHARGPPATEPESRVGLRQPERFHPPVSDRKTTRLNS